MIGLRKWRPHEWLVRTTKQQLNLLAAIVAAVRAVWPFMLLGLVIRIIFIPISLDGDLVGFTQTSASELYGAGPYSYSSIYPPFWAFYLNVVGHFASIFVSGSQWLVSNPETQYLWGESYGLAPNYMVNLAYVSILKGSLIPFEVGVGLLLYHFARQRGGDQRRARTAFALWFLNPLVISVSAIHGTFDSIPTLCVIAAITLSFENRQGWSGVSIAVGTLFKIFPVLFAPLLLAMAWNRGQAGIRARFRSTGTFLAGLVAVPAITFTAPGLLSQFLASSTIGVRTGEAVYKGLGFWGVFAIPGLAPAADALGDSSYGFVSLLTLALFVAAAVAVRYLLVPGPVSASDHRWPQAALLVSTSAFLITVSNEPQYTVWLVPFLVILSLESRLFLRVYVVLSALATIFYLVIIGGPLLFFLPLRYSFHALDFSVFATSIAYWVGPGRQLAPIVSVAYSITLVACTVLVASNLFRHHGGDREALAPVLQEVAILPKQPQDWEFARAVIVLLLVGGLASEAFLFVPSLQPSRTLGVSTQTAPGSIIVNSTMWSSYTGTYRQVYAWNSVATSITRIYYYFDATYSTADVAYISWVGFPVHLREVLAFRGIPIQIAVLNATQLRSMLTDVSTLNNSLLVVASGALPSTVYTNSTNLVLPWLRQGGRLFWVGAPIGYYVAEERVPLIFPPPPSSPGRSGVASFLNLSLLGGPNKVYFNSTFLARALNLNFTNALDGGFNFNTTSLRLAGGEAIGNQADGYTNGAAMPVGLGFLVDLTGDLLNPTENELATSVLNMLQLGLFGGSLQVLGFRDIVVQAGQETTWTTSVPVLSQPTPTRRFCIFTSQADLTAFYASSTCITG